MDKAMTSLADALNELITAKQLKDNKKFTASQLAKAIAVDRSLIQRILTGEVNNPTVNTLIKIVNFFVEDGFNLRLDDLIPLRKSLVNVQGQAILSEKSIQLPLYQMENFQSGVIGEVATQIQDASPCLIALVSSQDIAPIFKAGSIFVVDIMKKAEPENLVVLRMNQAIKIAKCTHSNKEKIFELLSDKKITVRETEANKQILLGVVVRINAKT